MPGARLDRDVIREILLMNFERLGKRHVRGVIVSQGLLGPVVPKEFGQLRFGYREVRSSEALPNLFVVGERAGIISARLMAHQVLLAGFLPSFRSGFRGVGFHGFAAVCSSTVEYDRENGNKNRPPLTIPPMKTGL